MADYFTHFSCIFDVGSAENAAVAESIRGELAAELDRDEGARLGFEMEVDHGHGPGALWIYSEDCGEPEHVVAFVLRCADAFSLTGFWGFRWALTCSRTRPDGFGGGAQLIDLGQRESVDWTDCEHWLVARMSNARLDSNAAFAVAAAEAL